MMIEGTIDRTFIKPWTGRDGEKINLYSFKLREHPDDFFRTGQKNPGIKEGSVIRFAADEKNNVKVENIELISTGPAPAKQASSATSQVENIPQPAKAPETHLTKDSYWDRKEARDIVVQKAIQYQAARNAAIEATGLLVSSNSLSLPQGIKERYSVVMAAIDWLTQRFNADTDRLGPLMEESEAQPAKKRGTKPKAAPASGEQEEMPDLDLG